MRFLKSYNNSVALVKNEQGKEEIVIGKGIGFGLKKGSDRPRKDRTALYHSKRSRIDHAAKGYQY